MLSLDGKKWGCVVRMYGDGPFIALTSTCAKSPALSYYVRNHFLNYSLRFSYKALHPLYNAR